MIPIGPIDAIASRLTYHAVYEPTIAEALRFAAEDGFAGVQIAVESPHLAPDRLDRAERERIDAIRRELSLRISLHAPDEACSLLQTSPSLRDGSEAYLRELIDFAGEVGAELIVVHPGRIAGYRTDERPERSIPAQDVSLYRAALRENLSRLADLAADRVTVCVENHGWCDWIMDELDEALQAGRVALCWDIAKAFDPAGRVCAEVDAFCRRHIDRVRQVHLHDIRQGVSHRAIGTGALPWERLLAPLVSARVEEFCIEVRPRAAARASREALLGMIERWAPQPGAGSTSR